ncbi:sensor histidine kinase [Streptacidiphilus cavernicola]|uniref:histidine kinase n=1 Tax=Streptacidiphilus cavernicola TaxID=3342716 RepID=A0ABV6W1Z1_9ACTN
MRRRTVRLHTRLFAGFAAALVACAVLMVGVIYTGVRYLPDYRFAPAAPVGTATAPGTPVGTAAPTAPVGTVPQRPVPGPTMDVSPLPPDVPYDKTRAVTVTVTDKQGVWSAVLLISIGGVLLVALLGLAFGWVFSKRLLAPLHSINQAAASAADGDLTHRINAHGPADDLQELADTFDTMLARLQRSFAAHQRFAANASHELLTPLTTTRAALQLASSEPTVEELAELVPMLTEANERNIAIVRSLLQLADADGVPAFDETPVDISALVARAASERAEAAAERGIRVELATSTGAGGGTAPGTAATNTHTRHTRTEVRGNAALLHQLVLNLLDNALRHNVPGGSARLEVRRQDDDVVLSVSNTGPPVAADQVDRLFEPFYRAQSRVSSDRSGHGLGLAIVRTVAQAHHGTATARPQPDGGLLVHVALPAADRPTAP